MAKQSDTETDDGKPATGTRLSATEIHRNVRTQAEEEMRRPAADLLFSAVAAGLTIGWSFVLGSFLTTLVPPAYHKAVNAAAYPVGFIFVIIGRNQLFTENTLEPVIPVLARRTGWTVVAMLRLWALVFAGNMIGALLFALLLSRTSVVSLALQDRMLSISRDALVGGFGLQLYRAVFAGWLIALTAWLVSATTMTGAQIVLIWLTTAPIAALDFRHSIAGSVEAFYAALSHGASWMTAIGDFVVPAVIGNIIGGVLFVALLNHGQVAGAWRRKVATQRS